MQLPALLGNENVPALLIAQLRASGLTVAASVDLMPSASDRVVLQHAHQQGLWTLTFDQPAACAWSRAPHGARVG